MRQLIDELFVLPSPSSSEDLHEKAFPVGAFIYNNIFERCQRTLRSALAIDTLGSRSRDSDSAETRNIISRVRCAAAYFTRHVLQPHACQLLEKCDSV
eukprot:scaffold1966_cov118-Isochrysis_galbana.AAC.7